MSLPRGSDIVKSILGNKESGFTYSLCSLLMGLTSMSLSSLGASREYCTSTAVNKYPLSQASHVHPLLQSLLASPTSLQSTNQQGHPLVSRVSQRPNTSPPSDWMVPVISTLLKIVIHPPIYTCAMLHLLLSQNDCKIQNKSWTLSCASNSGVITVISPVRW